MRRHDWPERLVETISAARTKTFRWGRHDCALFACDCIQAMTGADPAKRFRGAYRTPGGALRALKRLERVTGLEALADRVLGPQIPVARARRGDLVLAERGDGPALGVVTGSQAAFLGPEGLEMLPLAETSTAWRV